ncbi:MAG: DegT/DnrJ/EryC1/StrS family aminotransferase [Betaproteobacteria bacterium]|nr:MAG: DegT/DnrJ/EryC1/StrS family aminotransferase [Betaproteobacteria bacterium]
MPKEAAAFAAPTRVPMLDLKAQHGPIEAELRAAVERIFASSEFVLGKALNLFEEEFAAFCGTADAVAVSSGTSALHLALRCCEIQPGDEVITVSMSFIATAWPMLYEGARPVFVDIDSKRYTMDPEALARAITPRTRAIIVVHLYGQCADMDPILEIAKGHDIPVIEDAAQAVGALYKGRRAGSMGSFGCFSFYPSKNLGGAGDGGAVTTQSPKMAARLRRLRNHAQLESYWSDEIGYNYRLDSIQCAVLSVKLPRVDRWVEQRRRVAEIYDRELKAASIALPHASSDGIHAYHLYVIKDARRDQLRRALSARGVQSAIHYPNPIHRQPPYRDSQHHWNLPVTEELALHCLSLPLYPELSDAQIEAVIQSVLDARG